MTEEEIINDLKFENKCLNKNYDWLEKKYNILVKHYKNKLIYTKKLEKDLFENCNNYVVSKNKIKEKIEFIKSLKEKLYYEENVISILQDLLGE